MLLPCVYNAPIVWYSLVTSGKEDIWIEQFDNYSKQTYRNRCSILGANGMIDLVIPVVKMHGKKTLMRDVKIDYDTSWNKNHWKSIFSAYSSAPFFEYMSDTYFPFYQKRFTYLVDLNLELIEVTLNLLNLEINFQRTERFIHSSTEKDLRQAIHPKYPFAHPVYHFNHTAYHQVFSERHGFIPNLSILDLLFNEGPAALSLIKKSVVSKE